MHLCILPLETLKIERVDVRIRNHMEIESVNTISSETHMKLKNDLAKDKFNVSRIMLKHNRIPLQSISFLARQTHAEYDLP